MGQLATLFRNYQNPFEVLAEQGRMFAANMGTVTTPLTFLVTAANRPDAWVRNPLGAVMLPYSLAVTLEAMAGTATEIDVRIASNDIGDGTSSAASVSRSLRTDAPVASLCTARQLATANTTAETTPVSVYRKTYILANAAGEDAKGGLITREQMGNPICVNASTWELFVAATTTQAVGFVVMTWAEVPATWL